MNNKNSSILGLTIAAILVIGALAATVNVGDASALLIKFKGGDGGSGGDARRSGGDAEANGGDGGDGGDASIDDNQNGGDGGDGGSGNCDQQWRNACSGDGQSE